MPLGVLRQTDDLYVVASGPVLLILQPGHGLSYQCLSAFKFS